MVTSPSWPSGIAVPPPSLTPTSNSRGRQTWLLERRMEQRDFGGFPCPFRSDRNLRWLDVCIFADAPKKGFAFAVRGGCRDLASEVGRGQRFERSSRSIRAHSRVSSVPSCQMSIWKDQVRTRMRVACPKGVSPRLSPRCRCNFWIPSKWTLAACGGFSRKEHILILEAQSILYAVWCAESRYPPGRFVIPSDPLCVCTCGVQRTFKPFYIAFSHASDLCVWFQGQVSSCHSGGSRQS